MYLLVVSPTLDIIPVEMCDDLQCLFLSNYNNQYSAIKIISNNDSSYIYFTLSIKCARTAEKDRFNNLVVYINSFFHLP